MSLKNKLTTPPKSIKILKNDVLDFSKLQKTIEIDHKIIWLGLIILQGNCYFIMRLFNLGTFLPH